MATKYVIFKMTMLLPIFSKEIILSSI